MFTLLQCAGVWWLCDAPEKPKGKYRAVARFESEYDADRIAVLISPLVQIEKLQGTATVYVVRATQ